MEKLEFKLPENFLAEPLAKFNTDVKNITREIKVRNAAVRVNNRINKMKFWKK